MPDDQIQELVAEVRRLGDILAIMELKARYCRCVDMKDWTGFGATLTDDHELVNDGGVRKGRDEVVSFVIAVLGDAMSVHHAHSPEITITGPDTATGIWAKHGYVIIPNADTNYVVRGYGHYHEDYVRTAAGWRIARCVESSLQVDADGEVPAFVTDLARHPT